MLWGRWKAMAGLSCWLVLGGPGAVRCGAEPATAQASITAELQALAAAARTIFVGQIVAIQHKGGVVEVAFRVEQPVAGAGGNVFTMREWAGRWPPETQRYIVGERVLAFVYGTSAAGFSSPVRGAEGLVPVVVQGADAPRLLDIRRVAASVVRAPGTALPNEADGAIPLNDVLALVGARQQRGTVLPVRLPLPVRGRPPVELPEATRASVPVGAALGGAAFRSVPAGIFAAPKKVLP